MRTCGSCTPRWRQRASASSARIAALAGARTASGQVRPSHHWPDGRRFLANGVIRPPAPSFRKRIPPPGRPPGRRSVDPKPSRAGKAVALTFGAGAQQLSGLFFACPASDCAPPCEFKRRPTDWPATTPATEVVHAEPIALATDGTRAFIHGRLNLQGRNPNGDSPDRRARLARAQGTIVTAHLPSAHTQSERRG